VPAKSTWPAPAKGPAKSNDPTLSWARRVKKPRRARLTWGRPEGRPRAKRPRRCCLFATSTATELSKSKPSRPAVRGARREPRFPLSGSRGTRRCPDSRPAILAAQAGRWQT
jgi:hypothetical protein